MKKHRKISKTGTIDLQRKVKYMQGQKQALEEKGKLITKEEKETLKKTKKTIREAIKELRKRGVIQKRNRQTANRRHS